MNAVSSKETFSFVLIELITVDRNNHKRNLKYEKKQMEIHIMNFIIHSLKKFNFFFVENKAIEEKNATVLKSMHEACEYI